MNDFIGLNDCDGTPIRANDVLVKHYDEIPEVTEESWAKLQRENPHVTFGLSVMPHKAIPAHDDQWIVEYDPSKAQWVIPRDYDGLPELAGWRVKK